MSSSNTSLITLQNENTDEFNYVISLDATSYVSNWLIMTLRDHGLVTFLNILASPVGNAAAGSYFGERASIIFSGKKFVENNENFWNYAENIIGSGISAANWMQYLGNEAGGYYNYVEVIDANSNAAALDIRSKYIGLDAFLLGGKVLYDLNVSYV